MVSSGKPDAECVRVLRKILDFAQKGEVEWYAGDISKEKEDLGYTWGCIQKEQVFSVGAEDWVVGILHIWGEVSVSPYGYYSYNKWLIKTENRIWELSGKKSLLDLFFDLFLSSEKKEARKLFWQILDLMPQKKR